MQGDYLSSLILAIYALRNQLTDEWPQYPGDEIKQIVEQSGMFLGDNAVRTLTGLIEKQHQQAQIISADNVQRLLQRVPGIASLNIIDTQLVENITGHLLRCLAAPVWIAEHRQSSMNNLKAAWPAAFDMSLHFITLLREQLDIPLFDSDRSVCILPVRWNGIKTNASRSFCSRTRTRLPLLISSPLSAMFYIVG